MKHSTQTLRDDLFQTMTDLSSGKVTIKEANTKVKIASQAIYLTRLELENKRMEIKLKNAIPANKIASIPALKM